MALTNYLEEQQEQSSPIVKQAIEWDGRDFRGDKCVSSDIQFMREHPLVFRWLRNRPRGSIHNGCTSLRNFCLAMNVTPEKFLQLDKKQARDLLWEYIEGIKTKKPAKAIIAKNNAKMFYLYHREEELLFIRGKHDIVYEPKKIKEHMDKETCWRIIQKTKNLRDEALLLLAFESGLRRNAIDHMTYGHFKKFIWFYNDTIAIFRVVAKPNRDYTHDNKLRGKGISWYYGCLHKEATKILKEFVAKYHQGSTDETPLWFSLHPLNRNKAITTTQLWYIIKGCIRRAGLNPKKISFHSMRRGFKGVVRNTKAITDHDYKEAIMGHKLKGSQEAYFDKDPKEFAREYAKCDFSPPTEITEKLQKKVEELEDEVTQLKVEQTSQNNDWYSQYQRDMMPTTTPKKTEPNTPPKPLSNMPIVKEQSKEAFFTCQLDAQAYQLSELPCRKNENYVCGYRVCQSQVATMIREHQP